MAVLASIAIALAVAVAARLWGVYVLLPLALRLQKTAKLPNFGIFQFDRAKFAAWTTMMYRYGIPFFFGTVAFLLSQKMLGEQP